MTQKDDPDPAPLVDVQIALSDESMHEYKLPSAEHFLRWVQLALPSDKANSELTIRLVEKEESQQLNRQYRNKDKPTNVLSFPCALPPGVNIPLLGDLAICAPIIKSEATEQGKDEMAHWAHMVIHGTLHLLGYDHIEDVDASKMEALESKLITSLGYPAPYEVD